MNASEFNQMEILDNFKLATSHYTELLQTVIKDTDVSQDSGEVNGTFYIESVPTKKLFFFILIFLKGMDETFDVLILENITHMICYQKVLLTKNYSHVCEFPMLLNQNNYSLELVRDRINKWQNSSSLIIIDNTPFPVNGSNGTSDILITSTYSIIITPSNTFYIWTEICNN